MENSETPPAAPTIEKGYIPTLVEPKWYAFWLAKNYFKPDENSTAPTFSVVIPPPNVTGVLHMGHALNCTIQDILVRFKRMQGFNTVWIPGMDHAGISTQIVVEKMLAKDGIKREVLGREKFVEKIWEWKEKSGGMILEQQKRLGISVDWSRLKFTLDEDMSMAVKKVFVDLHKEKLIYRGNRLINWCPRCGTAVSDLEVKHHETKGTLWHIKYLLEDGTGEVFVATTRPETLLGDTAVAVNPKDARYKNIVGKKVKLPLTSRTIPVIADDMVAQEFGSGVVKITPAHDFNDYETAQRNGLPMIGILDKKAVLNEYAGAYKGLKVHDARKKVLEDLVTEGLLLKEESHLMSVGKCDRCETVIEPMLSDQWFVKIKPLAEPAIKVVENKDLKFYPENWSKTYLDWLYNIKDWCISRQLWWGHRIPAWYCDDCKHITVTMDIPHKCEKCASGKIHQDEDVLDTWFSSWLWPMSTMGWPDETPTLKKFYPTSVLVTGFDIIFFWVARMVMSGLHFKKQIPFKDVYIHALIRDERGQKMSKSKGNVVDPLDLVNDYGTDALRFTLASMVGAGRDIKFSEDRLDGYRHFINKIWNATRFSQGALAEVKIAENIDATKITLSDKFIIYELKKTVEEVTKSLEEYRFTDAATSLYKFTWNEFCDWYLEFSKPTLYGTDLEQKSQSGAVLYKVLDTLMKLLHPFIPFVTEEIYHLLPKHGESLCVEKYPTVDDPFFMLASSEAAREVEAVKLVVSAVRNIRGENRISPAIKIKFSVALDEKSPTFADSKNDSLKNLNILRANDSFIRSLGRAEEVTYFETMPETKKSAITLITMGSARLHVIVPLEGLVDFNEEIKRLNKDLERVAKDYEMAEKKLSTETFIKNAPKEIVEQEKLRIVQLQDKKKQLLESLALLK